MADMLRVARLFLVLLALVTAGRWLMGTFGVPYENGHHVFSIVILTAFSCIYYGAFTRRWLDYRLIQAVMLGVGHGGGLAGGAAGHQAVDPCDDLNLDQLVERTLIQGAITKRCDQGCQDSFEHGYLL